RLALALAGAMLDVFPDGIWFVDLSAVTDRSVVPSAIAQVLGLREDGPQSELESIKFHVHDKHMLLVLANLEQALTAAADLAELLGACQRLKLLVTSRAPLHIYGEHEFPVAPLELPAAGDPTTLEGLSQYEAVALFIQRAEAARFD